MEDSSRGGGVGEIGVLGDELGGDEGVAGVAGGEDESVGLEEILERWGFVGIGNEKERETLVGMIGS